MQSFKDILKELREERGLSMKELGSEIGVSDAAVCKWENGGAEPKLTYILRLADFFECSTDFLLGRDDYYQFSDSAERPVSFDPRSYLVEESEPYIRPENKLSRYNPPKKARAKTKKSL